MASLVNPKAWVPTGPHTKTKDCSQGFCSLHCPRWCYTPPPPPPSVFQEDNSGPMFSPLVIAIIGILASAFLLVSYYAIISKYCGNRRGPSSTRTDNHHVPDEEEQLEESTQDPSNHETWYVSNNGLDESLIKSITVCKYKKGGGLVESTDCSVCLGEFQEDESLRLLPKCSHAFHVNCIDTWLKSHSNCPLCRASLGFINPTPVSLPPPPPPPPPFLYDDGDSDTSVVLERQEPWAINHSSRRQNNAFPLPPPPPPPFLYDDNAFPLPPPPPTPFLYDDSDSDTSVVLERQEEPCAINHSSERQNNNAFPLPLPPPPPPPPPFPYDDSDSDTSLVLERQEEPCTINHSSERQNNNDFPLPPPPPPVIYARDEDFTTRRASSDVGNSMEGDSIIEIRE